MINVKEILKEVCEDERIEDDSIDLIDSGILDSLAMIELFAKLEENDIIIQPTRIDIDNLRSIKKIEALIKSYEKAEN